MWKDKIRIGRKLPRIRIAAYESEVDQSGKATPHGKQVVGWYGAFTTDMLENQIMPKLSEYVAQGSHYPFLIVTYLLNVKADVKIKEPVPRGKLKGQDVGFSPRRRSSPRMAVAIVYERTKYKLINQA